MLGGHMTQAKKKAGPQWLNFEKELHERTNIGGVHGNSDREGKYYHSYFYFFMHINFTTHTHAKAGKEKTSNSVICVPLSL